MKSDELIKIVLFICIVVVIFLILRMIAENTNDRFLIKLSNETRSEPKVLFVIAHPDDESMFFSPTIRALHSRKAEIYFLCLSTGNFKRNGTRRTQEMNNLLKSLEIPSDHLKFGSFRDDPKLYWDTDQVKMEIKKAVSHWDINAIISFDKYGVSGHLNHISCYYAIKELETKAVKYKLNSYPTKHAVGLRTRSVSPTFALQMLSEHESQATWWRKLFILSAKHTYLNELIRVK